MSDLGKQLRTFNWTATEPFHSVLLLPAIGLPLILGVALGYPGTGVLMAGGAQTVGFGSFQQPLFRRSAPMALAAIGIAVSAMAGALCRDSTPALLVAVLIWTLLYGLGTSISSSTGWVCQQCCVFLIVSSAAVSTPGTTHDLVKSALLRGAGVLAGGALQTGLVVLFRRIWPEAQTHFSKPDFDPTHFQTSFLREQLSLHSGTLLFTLRLVTTCVFAVGLYRHLGFQNAYWIGMTAVLIPKPEWTQTAARSLLRTMGTILGAAVCTLIIVLAHPRGEILTALVLLFLFLSYLFTNVNYGVFATVLTGYICFLLAIVHQPAHDVLIRRVGATAAGCGIAIGVHLVSLGLRQISGFVIHPVQTLEARISSRPQP